MGKNIKTIRKTTLKKCQMACDKEKRCKGVEFFRASGASMTSPSYREGDCLLNSDTNLKRCDADYYQLYFWQKSNNKCDDTCQIYTEKNGCVMGKNMRKIKRTTIRKCQLACSQNKACQGVEFFQKSDASVVSPTYEEGDCLLNSDYDLKNCDADYWQMYFWEQGPKVECSKKATTGTSGTSSSANRVNKYTTSYYKPTTAYTYRYSSSDSISKVEGDIKNTEKVLENAGKDLLGEF